MKKYSNLENAENQLFCRLLGFEIKRAFFLIPILVGFENGAIEKVIVMLN